MSEKRTLTIEEFCQQVGIGRTLYYDLQERGLGPRVVRLGRRVLITPESIEDWLRAREEDGDD